MEPGDTGNVSNSKSLAQGSACFKLRDLVEKRAEDLDVVLKQLKQAQHMCRRVLVGCKVSKPITLFWHQLVFVLFRFILFYLLIFGGEGVSFSFFISSLPFGFPLVGLLCSLFPLMFLCLISVFAFIFLWRPFGVVVRDGWLHR